MKPPAAVIGVATAMLMALTPVTAAGANTQPVITPSLMTLSLPPPTPAGVDFFIGAKLTSAGQPVSQGLIYLFINGAKRHEMRSDLTGSVRFHRVGNVADGSYKITVAYRGDHDPHHLVRPGPASASGTLVVTAAGISLLLPPPTPAGHPLTITAVLYTEGSPEPGADLLVSVNDTVHRRARTDSTGTAHVVLAGDLAAGSYQVSVRYLGHRRPHNQATRSTFAAASGTLVILPDGIVLDVPSAAAPGQKLEFSAHLYSRGVVVPKAHLSLFVDGRFRRQERTDAGGTASFALLGTLGAGAHQFTVQYTAPHGRRSASKLVLASSTSVIEIRPLVLTVQTVPIISGVMFVLDGVPFTSDATGMARISVATAGIHNLNARLQDPNSDTHLEFGRWGDDAFTADRQVRMQGDVHLSAGLRLAYRTQLQFATGQGAPLDRNRISNVLLSGPNAELVQVAKLSEPVWLKTALPTKRSGADGLFYSPTPYTITSADYDGLSVVDRGSQPYLPGSGPWTMTLKLYTMRIHAQDALFGLNVADPATVTDQIGVRRQINLDMNGNAVLLVGRGNYTVHVVASGISPLAPVALSRSKQAIVPIISVLDLTVIGAALSLTLASLYLVGRRRPLLARALTLGQAISFRRRHAS